MLNCNTGNGNIEKSLQHIKEQHEEIYGAYENFVKLMQTEGGTLDEKTRVLIRVSLSAANKTLNILRVNIYKALAVGCGFKDVEHAIFLTVSTVGFPAMLESYWVFREIVDESAPSNNVVLDNIISH